MDVLLGSNTQEGLLFTQVLNLNLPISCKIVNLNVNYNIFVGRKKTVVILIFPSCSLLKSSSSCAASFVVIFISTTHYQLFLAYPSLLPSFLNSWQTYGPILAFQVKVHWYFSFALSQIVILLTTWTMKVKMSLVFIILTENRGLLWESAQMISKWQISF